MKQVTAVEWLVDYFSKYVDMKKHIEEIEQAKEMEKQQMIDLVQHLKDYTAESNNILGFDEREAIEFVDIFYNQNFK
jgi:helix-turn-helix protein